MNISYNIYIIYVHLYIYIYIYIENVVTIFDEYLN